MRFALVLALAVLASGCSKKVDEPADTEFKPTQPPPPPPGPKTLEKVDTVVGTGPEAVDGDKVKVEYTGSLLNGGAVFDSSVGRAPFEFELGKGNVIKGWDQGVPGMKVGGKRTLTIPSDLAYGEGGSGEKIPPNAPLKFDVELLSIEGKPWDAGAPAAAKDAGAKKK